MKKSVYYNVVIPLGDRETAESVRKEVLQKLYYISRIEKASETL